MASFFQLRQVLNSLGFEEKESTLYLKSLEMGRPVSAGQLSKLTGIKRTTVYHNIEALEKRGLMSSMVINDVMYFQSEPFKKIEELLSKQEKELQRKKEIIAESMELFEKPSMLQENESKIEYFYGKEEFGKFVRATDWSKPHNVFFCAEKFARIFHEDKFYGCDTYENHVKCQGRILLTNTEGFKRCQKMMSLASRSRVKKFIPKPINDATAIFDDYVMIEHFDPDNLYCVRIYNKLLAESYRYTFEQFWSDR